MKINPNLYALIGAILYGVGNPIIEKKLSTISPLSFLACEGVVMFILILICQGILWFASPTNAITLPNIGTWKWIIICSALVFGAGMFYIQAFTSGGDAITISLMLLLTPVATAIVSAMWTKKLPTTWHIIGYIFAALAVLCIVKSNSAE